MTGRTEALPDPHYQSVARVRALAADAGSRETGIVRRRLASTINFAR
jgi:hypothetical protein